MALIEPDGKEIMLTLDEIYALVPTIACQGLCAAQCSIIPMTPPEYRRLKAGRTGRKANFSHRFVSLAVIMPAQGSQCPILTPSGRCGRYASRPLICRLWGVTEGMPCLHGCRPERILTVTEARFLLDAAQCLETKEAEK